MNIYEHYTDSDVDEIGLGIGKVAHNFSHATVARA